MNRRPILSILVAAAAACSLACASSSGGATSGSESAAPRRDRTVITADEMRDVPASNLYDVVQRLHPEWLIVRTSAGSSGGGGRSRGGGSSSAGIQVYIDQQRAGDTEMLKQLAVSAASSLKYYTASEAQSRFGGGNLAGVIQIVSVTK